MIHWESPVSADKNNSISGGRFFLCTRIYYVSIIYIYSRARNDRILNIHAVNS